MQLTKFVPIILALATFSTPRAMAEAEYTPAAVEAQATATHFAGFSAITIVNHPGAEIDVWAVGADGEIVPVAHGIIGQSGTATVFAPSLGAGFLVESIVAGVDIRDWLE